MTKIHLSRGARLLYNQITLLELEGLVNNFDLREFRSFAQEYTGKPFTWEEIRELTAELESCGLLEVDAEYISGRWNEMDRSKFDSGF